MTDLIERLRAAEAGKGRAHGLVQLVGARFGRLSVLERAGSDGSRAATWLTECDCGNRLVVTGASLRRGVTVSCGCYGKERRLETRMKHSEATRGEARSPEYNAWVALNNRCHNPKHPNYQSYGGRGISVCDAWADDFSQFLSDMGRKPSRQHSIERLDNDAGYNPSNCVWGTKQEQSLNRRATKKVARSDGAKFPSIAAAAKATGVHPTSISAALLGKQKSSGGYTWSLLQALNEAPK